MASVDITQASHEDVGKNIKFLNRFNGTFIGLRNLFLEQVFSETLNEENQENNFILSEQQQQQEQEEGKEEISQPKNSINNNVFIAIPETEDERKENNEIEIINQRPRISMRDISFTAKQAKIEIQQTITTSGVIPTPILKNATKIIFYARHNFFDQNLSRVRTDLYIKTIGSFTKVSSTTSSQFIISRLTIDPTLETYIRLIYYYEKPNHEWEPFGYVTELVNQIQEEDQGDGVIEKNIRSANEASHIGTVVMSTEEENNSPFNAIMKFSYKEFGQKSKSARYLRIERLIKGMGMVSVYTTPIPATGQGEWSQIKIPLRKLCNGNIDLEINLVLEELDPVTKASIPIGFHVTTFARCERAQGGSFALEFNNKVEQDGPRIYVKKCLLERFFGVEEAVIPESKDKKHILSRGDLKLRTFRKGFSEKKSENTFRVKKQQLNHQMTHQLTLEKRKHAKGFTRFIYDLRLWIETEPLKRFYSKLPLEKTVLEISFEFGSEVSAFFQFYKSVILLNFCLAIIWMAVIVVPKGIDMKEKSTFVDSLQAFTGFRNTSAQTTAIWSLYGDYSSSIIGSGSVFESNFSLQHRKSGSGIYPDDYFHGNFDSSTSYAWCVVVTILLSLFLVLREASDAFDSTDKISNNSDGELFIFSSHCFGAWDYMCGTSRYNLAQICGYNSKIKTLRRAQEIEEMKKKKRQMPLLKKSLIWLRRGFFISISILSAFAAITAIIAIIELEDQLSQSFQFIPSILLACINACIPTFVSICVKLEKWDDISFEDKNIIGREFLLKITNILTLYYHSNLLIYRKKMESQGFQCIQDLIGTIFLRLYVTEFISDFITSIIWPFLNKYIFKGKRHFPVSNQILALLYRQLIVWTATPYCPILPFIAVIGGYIGFTWKSFSLVHFSTPSTRSWLVGKPRLFFLQMMLLTLFVGVIPEIFFLFSNFSPQTEEEIRYACGPHIDWSGDQGKTTVFSYLLNWKNLPYVVQLIIGIAFHPVFLILCLLVTSTLIIWLATFLSTISRELREVTSELVDEHHDKMVLLKKTGVEI